MSKVLTFCATTLIALLLVSRAAFAAPPVIINPSFEANGTVDYSGGILPPITGWSVTGQRVVILSGEGKTDGNFAAVFDNGLSSSNPPSATHSGQISQTFAVSPNTDYAVFYDYGVFGNLNQTQKLQVQAGLLNHTDVHTISNNPTLFRKYAHPFTTDGSGYVTLSFKDATTTGEDGLADGILDAIFSEQVIYHTSFEASQSNYTITTSNIDPPHAVVYDNSNYGGQSMDGSQFLAFNGGGSGENDGNAIVTSDAFATRLGEGGHIFFDFGNYGSGSAQSLLIELLDAATNLPYFAVPVSDSVGTTAANSVMDGYLYEYTALATSTRIRVTDTSGGPTGGSDALLDNIIVTIPEPTALSLLGLGTFPFLLRAARRRQSHFST